VGFREAAGQVQARLDQWQRGARLSLTQQEPGSLVQHHGDQVVVSAGASGRDAGATDRSAEKVFYGGSGVKSISFLAASVMLPDSDG
jgi:hypothetical protein